TATATALQTLSAAVVAVAATLSTAQASKGAASPFIIPAEVIRQAIVSSPVAVAMPQNFAPLVAFLPGGQASPSPSLKQGEKTAAEISIEKEKARDEQIAMKEAIEAKKEKEE